MKKRAEKLTNKEKLAITEYKNSLLKEFPRTLKKIILFGSKARGASTSASDVDLLIVVTKNGKKMTQKIAMLTHNPIAKYMVDISPILVEETFFKNWSPLLEHINKEGIVLWTKKKAKKNI